jgi:sugar phosphate isomerase/epimerase
MNIGVCQPPDAIKTEFDGLEFIEPTVKDMLCPGEDDEQFARRLDALNACPYLAPAVNCLFPGEIKTTGPDVDEQAVDQWFTTVAWRAKEAGVSVVVYGSGGSRTFPEGFDRAQARGQVIGHLLRFAPIAEAHDITLVLEPLHAAECNIINTVAEGAEVVAEVDHPRIRLLADTYHMAVDDEDPDNIRAAGDLIVHVHVAESAGRRAVGTAENHRPYFAALKDAGYDGALSIEARWDNMEAQLPKAISDLRRQWEEA